MKPQAVYSKKKLSEFLPEKHSTRIRLLSLDYRGDTEADEIKIMQSLAQYSETPDIIGRSQKSALASIK